MSIKNALLAGVAGAFLAGSAMAAEPVTLTNDEMDAVTAGFNLTIALGLQGPVGAAGFGSSTFETLNQTSILESFSAGTSAGTSGTFAAQGAVGTNFQTDGAGSGAISFIGTSFGIGGTVEFP